MPIDKLADEVLRKHKGISFVGVVTCFILYNEYGEFFMAKRSKNARDENGKWEIQGGGLKWGQTVKDNATREMEEESNAKPKKMEFLGYRDVFRKLDDETPTHWVALDFAVLVDKKDIRINENDMFDDSDWFTLSKQPRPVHSQHKLILRKYKNQLQKIIKS